MIFFDIDETLVDQRQAEAAAAVSFLAVYGDHLAAPWSLEQFCDEWRALREKHLPDYLRGAVSYQEYHRRRIRELFADGASLSDRQCDARYNAFQEEYRAAWRLFDDALPCLDACEGCPLGIVSNGNTAQQRQKLENTGILERFELVVISEEVGVAKPHHGIFLEACRRACRVAADCAYLGDQLDVDARGSSAAGMRGIWLDRRGSSSVAGVEVVRSLAELPAILSGDAAGVIESGTPGNWP